MTNIQPLTKVLLICGTAYLVRQSLLQTGGGTSRARGTTLLQNGGSINIKLGTFVMLKSRLRTVVKSGR